MTNKIYLVTAGQYSDYGVVRAFLNKEKAERYSELYENSRVEEMDNSDDLIGIADDIKPCNTMSVWINKNVNGNTNYLTHFFDNFSRRLNIDNDTNYFLNDHKYKRENILEIGRHFNVDDQLEDEVDMNKLNKIMQDKFAEVCYKIEVEGWSINQIKDWLER